ncbi:MAG: iron-sulfur cluster assembly accessory protein [Proteobacteria bacterium]|nr:iron-sulfur cluster assembly accessory protein [Pseudomonadota bacterium]MCH8137836.1 iron-sulfur cluster assembly accessory protein [Pseudomonadota bacterium]
MEPTLKPISLTDAAAERVKEILAARDEPAVGLRIGIAPKGCSGNSYIIDYAEEIGPHDEVIETKGVTIVIDPGATLVLIGTEIDYVEGKLHSGFVFANPNEKGRCGCGESFTV